MKNKKLLTVLLGTIALCFVFASCKKTCVCKNTYNGTTITLHDKTKKDCKKWEHSSAKCVWQ